MLTKEAEMARLRTLAVSKTAQQAMQGSVGHFSEGVSFIADMEYLDKDRIFDDPEEVEFCDTVYREPFNFYGGYMRMSLRAKDEALASEGAKQMLNRYSYLKL